MKYVLKGGIKVALNVGFWYDEVNNDVPGVDLTNGQQHVVTVQRYNRGRQMRVKVKYIVTLNKNKLPHFLNT